MKTWLFTFDWDTTLKSAMGLKEPHKENRVVYAISEEMEDNHLTSLHTSVGYL